MYPISRTSDSFSQGYIRDLIDDLEYLPTEPKNRSPVFCRLVFNEFDLGENSWHMWSSLEGDRYRRTFYLLPVHYRHTRKRRELFRVFEKIEKALISNRYVYDVDTNIFHKGKFVFRAVYKHIRFETLNVQFASENRYMVMECLQEIRKGSFVDTLHICITKPKTYPFAKPKGKAIILPGFE